MTHSEFTQAAFAYAKAQGCDNCETFYAYGDSFEINVQGGEVDRYAVSKTAGVSVRVCVDGKDGYAYTERIESPEKLVERAMDNARSIEVTDAHPMQGKCEYETAGAAASALEPLSDTERIALALALEKAVLAADTRVKRVIFCGAEVMAGGTEMQNTRGLSAKRTHRASAIYVIPSVEQDGEVQTGLGFRLGGDALDVAGCAREAVEDALNKLGGAPVASGAYPIIMKNLAMSDLLGAFSGMFSAEAAQKGCSLLAYREGETIFSPLITLWDDPFHEIAPRAFDGEGTPCKKKQIVTRGKLNTLLHNLKTAAKAGCETTGNAGRASAAAAIGVSPTVLYIEPGESGFDALVERMGNGLVVTDLDGLNAGVDVISGDFSLKATGRLVENGKLTRPVSRVTIAGNFLDMMKAVQAVGSDLRFSLNEPIAAPSLLVGSMKVAGE